MKSRILVTAYEDPDLDGTASAFGYAEFLQKNGRDAVAALFGIPHQEVQFALTTFHIPPLEDAERIIDDSGEIIIVDASDRRALSTKINPQTVIEVIDHRKIHEAHVFPNAKIQIELVGAAATLVAEKFYDSKTTISQQAAALLYSAIISNTVNFQAHVTTERDRKMAVWLKTHFVLPEGFVHDMFAAKSKFTKPLKDTIGDDFATFRLHNHELGIAQLELIGVDSFIQENVEEIKNILVALKREQSLDLIFLTCIDTEKAFNKIVVVDEETKVIVEKALKIEFDGGVAKRDGILMRKEIVPLIEQVLEVS